jgi:hypothetical protein
MYQILKISLVDGSSELWKETSDPAMAYELAELLHKATMGRSGVVDLDVEHQGAFTSHITKDGKSAWEECSLAAMPTDMTLH